MTDDHHSRQCFWTTSLRWGRVVPDSEDHEPPETPSVGQPEYLACVVLDHEPAAARRTPRAGARWPVIASVGCTTVVCSTVIALWSWNAGPVREYRRAIVEVVAAMARPQPGERGEPTPGQPISEAEEPRPRLEHIEAAAEQLRRGRWLAERGRLAEAEASFRRATEIDPDDPLSWAQLGAVLVGRDRGEEAFECYQRALALDPGNWVAHYNLAVWHGREGEIAPALACIESALATAPAGPEREAVVRGLNEEPALAAVRREPAFEALLRLEAAHGEQRQ